MTKEMTTENDKALMNNYADAAKKLVEIIQDYEFNYIEAIGLLIVVKDALYKNLTDPSKIVDRDFYI